MKRNPVVFILLVMVISFMPVFAHHTAFNSKRGPFPVKNQFPIRLQFLSFPAASANMITPNSLQVNFYYTHSNTFVRSPGVLQGTMSSKDRQEFSQVAALHALESNISAPYFIDSSLDRIVLALEYGITEKFSTGIEIPFFKYSGGFLDTPIEIFHNFAGYSNASRVIIRRDDSKFFISEPSAGYRYLQDFANPGVGDISLYLKHLILSENHSFATVSLQAAVKIPTGQTSSLKGSGSFDFGINLIADKSFGGHYLTTGISYIRPGTWKLIPDIPLRPIYSMILVYEYNWNNFLSLILQNQILTSPFSSIRHDELSKPSFEWTAGVKYDLSHRYRLALAITENYIYHENVPDFGFRVGMELHL